MATSGPFYDTMPGPERRDKLNEMYGDFEDAIANARGPQGWSPVVAVVTDGARRVLRITDWTGGEGTKPATGGYIGATGIVPNIGNAVDIRGAAGPSNTLSIGTVSSGASPSVTISGASPAQTLNFVLEKGAKGDKGDTGNTGPANTLVVGTVSSGPSPSVTITGASPNQTVNFVLEKGAKGDTGLKGDTGPKGDTGNTGSAGPANTLTIGTVTEGAANATLTGSSPNQVLNLRIPKGNPGTNGSAATVAVGTVTTGAPGTSVAVTNSGTSAAAVLNFTIPRGDAGVGSGDVTGPASSTDGHVVVFNGATGKQIKSAGALTKTLVGLGNVDNTSDANKPVSTATQTALNEKANLNGGNNFVGANSFDGILTLKNTSLATQDITFDGSTAAGMRVTNPNGYVSIAPLNSSGAHIYTNLPKFFFSSKPVSIGNAFASYNADLQLHRIDVNKVTIGATSTTFVDPVAAPTFNYSYLTANTLSNLNTVVGGFSAAYSTSGATGKPAGTDHAVLTMSHSALLATQMASDWRTNLWYVRTKNNGTWSAWATLWTSANLTNLNQLTNGPGYITAAGNAATTTKLATARAINGVNFDGTANITVVDATKEPAFAAGTATQYRRGDKTWQTLDKSAVGLGNVDNTADTAKPVSTAQQTALNLKANLASPTLTGVPTAPTAAVGTNTAQIATTAFVNAGLAGVNAAAISNTPSGSIAATTVQGAINELAEIKVDLAAATGASSVGFQQEGTGAVPTTVQSKLRETISVKDFGAVGDGTSDDTAAIQAALNYAAGRAALYFPAGRYKVTAGSLALSSGKITIYGDGVGNTCIQSSTGAGALLTLTQSDFTAPIHVHDLSFITYTQETQTGLRIVGNASDSQLNRVQARCSVERVEFRGDDVAAHGFQYGLRASNVHNLGLERIFAAGRRAGATRAQTTYMVAGIELTGDVGAIPSDFTIHGCYVFHAQNGFVANGAVEGVSFSQCYAVAVDNGFYSDRSIAGNRPWLSVIGCHAAAYIYGVRLINVPQSFISHNLLYKREEANAETIAVALTDCDLSSVSDNIIYNAAANYTTNGNFIGIVLGGTSNYTVVSGNTIDRVQYGVQLVGTAQNTRTKDNTVTTLFGSGTPSEYSNNSGGLGNKRLNNPAFESSGRYTGASTVFGTSLFGVLAVSAGKVEIDDEYMVTATVRCLKDATAGGLKAFISKASGSAVPTFSNTDTQVYGYTYLGASADGYITISALMKISTAGDLVLNLSIACSAGQATLNTNEAQISITRK